GAVNAALARMIQGQTLDFDEKSGKLLVRGPLLVGADPLEEAIIRTNDTAFTVKEARRSAADEVGRIRQRLEELGFEPAPAVAWAARWWPMLLVLAIAAFGAIKLVIGVARGKDVGFLVLGVFLTVIVGLAGFARRILRTRRGDNYLARLQSR